MDHLGEGQKFLAFMNTNIHLLCFHVYNELYIVFIKITFIKILVCKTNRHESHTFLLSVNIKCEILCALYSHCGRLVTSDSWALCVTSPAHVRPLDQSEGGIT